MRAITGVASRRALSAGTLLVFVGGLALYQMTSLVLGPVGSREVHFSLTIPADEVEDLSEPFTSTANVVLGTRATQAAAAVGAMTVFTPHRPKAASRPQAAPAAPTPVAPTPPPTKRPKLDVGD